jgi:short-subunit dehydrogenase
MDMSRRPFRPAYGPWALVAGGSQGLGAAFADELGRRGLNLVLVGRRPETLAETASRLRRAWEVEVDTVAADLGSPGATALIADAIGSREVGLVVANAALAPAGPFLTRSTAEVQALWAETRGAGVDVLASCPGAVTTPGYQVVARRQAPGTMAAAQVAVVTLDALGRGFRVVPGQLNRVSAFALSRLVPRRVAIAVFGRATLAALNQTGSQAGTQTGTQTGAPPG